MEHSLGCLFSIIRAKINELQMLQQTVSERAQWNQSCSEVAFVFSWIFDTRRFWKICVLGWKNKKQTNKTRSDWLKCSWQFVIRDWKFGKPCDEQLNRFQNYLLSCLRHPTNMTLVILEPSNIFDEISRLSFLVKWPLILTFFVHFVLNQKLLSALKN